MVVVQPLGDTSAPPEVESRPPWSILLSLLVGRAAVEVRRLTRLRGSVSVADSRRVITQCQRRLRGALMGKRRRTVRVSRPLQRIDSVRSRHHECLRGRSCALGRGLQPLPATSTFVTESGEAACRLPAPMPRGLCSQSGRLDRLTGSTRVAFPPVHRSEVVVLRCF
jgi:hypothetical protein